MALAIASLLAADSVRSLPMTSLRVLPCEMWRNEAFNDNVCGFVLLDSLAGGFPDRT